MPRTRCCSTRRRLRPTGTPVAAADAATTPEDTAVDVPVLANDSDPNGDPLSLTAAGAPANGMDGCHASAASSATRRPLTTPAATRSRTSSTDGAGHPATGTVTVTVTPVNDPPNPANDALVTSRDIPSTIAVGSPTTPTPTATRSR